MLRPELLALRLGSEFAAAVGQEIAHSANLLHRVCLDRHAELTEEPLLISPSR